MNNPVTPTTNDEIRLMIEKAVRLSRQSAHRRPSTAHLRATTAQRAARLAQQVQSAWPSSPVDWHRRVCPVGHRIILSGDLGDTTDEMRRRLEEWQSVGVTHIIDVRIEADDRSFVAQHAPDMGYTWIGVDDDGGHQPDEWFERGVAAALAALEQTDGFVLVHCHMGVNRGPSMGYAIKLALGADPITALDDIRAGRPIAAILYAEDALDWWGRTTGTEMPMDLLTEWFEQNPVDVGWIISRIARRRYE